VLLHDNDLYEQDTLKPQLVHEHMQQQPGNGGDLRPLDQQQQQQQQPINTPVSRLLAPVLADISSSEAMQSPVMPPTVESLKQLEQQQAAAEQQQQQDGQEVSQLTWSASFRSSHCGSDGASTYFYSVHTASEIGSSSARYANIWEGLGQECSVPAGLLAAVGSEDRAALLAAAAAAGRWRGKRRSSSSSRGGFDAAALQALQQAAGRLLQGGGRVPRPNVTGTALE
jgi:hypothetical protein